jgi:hypothetical protein
MPEIKKNPVLITGVYCITMQKIFLVFPFSKTSLLFKTIFSVKTLKHLVLLSKIYTLAKSNSYQSTKDFKIPGHYVLLLLLALRFISRPKFPHLKNYVHIDRSSLFCETRPNVCRAISALGSLAGF